MDKKTQNLRLDYTNMMAARVGENGFARAELEALAVRAAEAMGVWKTERTQGRLGWADLPTGQAEVVADILAYAQTLRKRSIENFVVLGIGGSSLGPIAVQQALNHLHYNDLPADRRGPRLFVEDNIDPMRMTALLDVIDLEKTVFNVISKSGETSETAAQFLIIRDLLQQRLGDRAAGHLVATTSRDSGSLIKTATREGYQCFYIPDGVGGRFSELCPVGLLPAAVCGIDIQALLDGAAHMQARCVSDHLFENPALLAATLQINAMARGRGIQVMMPYSDHLRYMADWFAQLWGESLGKRYDTAGREVRAGQTPVKALGATDQHSQLQLYMEGPFDKVITFITVDAFAKDVRIPHNGVGTDSPDFLCGHSLGELLNTEARATAYALAGAGQPNMTIALPEITPHTVGQLLFFFEMQTALTGFMLGIDPFDQPGVEHSKQATYALLGRPGYEEKSEQMQRELALGGLCAI